MNNHQKYAVYMRVSKDELNIENQRFDLENYIRNKNLDVYDFYEDVITGAKKTRPALDRLMQDARKGLFNHVLIWKVDRLGRSTLHLLQIVDEWENMGVNFTITTLGIDTTTPVGRFVFGLLSQVAELDRQFIRQRTNNALARIKSEIEKKGYYNKKMPDGSYKKVYSLGRPKGKKDNPNKPRKKKGYYLRDYKTKKRPPAKTQT